MKKLFILFDISEMQLLYVHIDYIRGSQIEVKNGFKFFPEAVLNKFSTSIVVYKIVVGIFWICC